MWSGPLTTFPVSPRLVASQIRRRIKRVFPQLGNVAIADAWSGVTGETVHGMPQIGQLRRGLWIASGFGGRGIAATATAGLLVTQGMLAGDERWRLFSPFELVWAGGTAGRVAAQAVYAWSRARPRPPPRSRVCANAPGHGSGSGNGALPPRRKRCAGCVSAIKAHGRSRRPGQRVRRTRRNRKPRAIVRMPANETRIAV